MGFEEGRRLLSPRDGASGSRVASIPAPSNRKPFVPPLERLTGRHAPRERAAPEAVRLSDRMVQGLQQAWDNSLPGGKSQEQGAVLMGGPVSSAKWRTGAPGDSGSWDPNYTDALPEEQAVGSAHTHPYDASEGGLEDVTFSGQDLARFVVVPDKVQVVQSGSSRFLVARSQEFDAMLEGLDDEGRQALFDRITETWNNAFATAKGTLQERAEEAVQATTRRFHLLYYRGQATTLRRAGR